MKMYFQQLMDKMTECDEIGLGIEGMLGRDVVTFLSATANSGKPITQCFNSLKQTTCHGLDEHELAML